jgi:hypothetical protein
VCHVNSPVYATYSRFWNRSGTLHSKSSSISLRRHRQTNYRWNGLAIYCEACLETKWRIALQYTIIMSTRPIADLYGRYSAILNFWDSIWKFAASFFEGWMMCNATSISLMSISRIIPVHQWLSFLTASRFGYAIRTCI